jgi:signal peptidase I
VSSALAMWKGLSLVTNTESPIVVVLSGSMEPGFRRGDLLFLTLPPRTPLRVGDITVYNVPGAAIPIVHRIIEVHDEYVALSLRRPAQQGQATARGSFAAADHHEDARRSARAMDPFVWLLSLLLTHPLDSHEGRQQPSRRYRAIQRPQIPQAE